MSTSVPKSVIIVGGSLAGLSHALVLLSLPTPPTSITILERSPSELLHNQGAGIVASPDVLAFFAEYVRAGRDIAITSPMRHYLDHAGKVIERSVEKRAQRMTSWDLLYHLLRWRVEGMQSEYVAGLQSDQRPHAEYRNGCSVTAIESTASGVHLSWNDTVRGPQTADVDLVIAADGGSSTVRRLLHPDTKRTYVGYVAWRGTVPETELSAPATEVFSEKFTFFHSDGNQILGYLIPGENGTLEPGKRLFNYVWYCNYPDHSPDLEELMTDTNGKRHAITLPVGTMSPSVWRKQQEYAKKVLPPQYAEAVEKTQQPFIQAVTDVITPTNSFLDGKVILVGDALAGFRPHTAASTGQACFDALRLGEWLGGKIDRAQYDEKVLEFSRRVQALGVELGERSQFGKHPLAG